MAASLPAFAVAAFGRAGRAFFGAVMGSGSVGVETRTARYAYLPQRTSFRAAPQHYKCPAGCPARSGVCADVPNGVQLGQRLVRQRDLRRLQVLVQVGERRGA